jgi:hypothetical protein
VTACAGDLDRGGAGILASAEGRFAHVLRLSDSTGLLEHACGATPRRSHGYCVDDAARALVVACRETDRSPGPARVAERCLAFVADALSPDGRCRNRLSYGRRWLDEPDVGDWWGRALWGLGTAAARHPDPWMRRDAAACFGTAACARSPWPRAMAFATLGAAELAGDEAQGAAAARLIADAAAVIGRAQPGAWPWPEPRLSYANALLPEALMIVGDVLGRPSLVAEGLDLLGWLLDAQTHEGHLSATPAAGRDPGEAPPGFDQQPIEVATLADACARAGRMTGDPSWAAGLDLALRWFLGDNDTGVAMCDPATGGGFDGLERSGRNANQGAESTLALISTVQQALGPPARPR